jgi:hypothetical protein
VKFGSMMRISHAASHKSSQIGAVQHKPRRDGLSPFTFVKQGVGHGAKSSLHA